MSRTPALAAALTLTALLAACGGGGDGATLTTRTVTPSAQTTSTSGSSGSDTSAGETSSTEASGPQAAVGDVVEAVDTTASIPMSETDPIVAPDGHYRVLVGQASSLDVDGVTKAAPTGGAWLVYKIQHDEPKDWEALGDSTAAADGTTGRTTAVELLTGGRKTPVALPKERGMESARAVAVAGDGKDARFTFTYDGLTQEIGADGKRRPGAGDAGYLPRRHGEAATITSKVGDGGKGWSGGAELRDVKVTVGAYDQEKKWAPAGQAWVTATGTVAEDTVSFYGETSATYDTVPKVTAVTLAGAQPVVRQADATLEKLRYTWLLPVAQVKDSMPLDMTVTSAATIGFAMDGLPTTGTLTYRFATQVGLLGDEG